MKSVCFQVLAEAAVPPAIPISRTNVSLVIPLYNMCRYIDVDIDICDILLLCKSHGSYA